MYSGAIGMLLAYNYNTVLLQDNLVNNDYAL